MFSRTLLRVTVPVTLDIYGKNKFTYQKSFQVEIRIQRSQKTEGDNWILKCLGFETDAYTHIHKDLDEWNSVRLFDFVSKQEAYRASFPHRGETGKSSGTPPGKTHLPLVS